MDHGFKSSNEILQRLLNSTAQANNALPDQRIKRNILSFQTYVAEYISKTKQIFSVQTLQNLESVCKLDLTFRVSLVISVIELLRSATY